MTDSTLESGSSRLADEATLDIDDLFAGPDTDTGGDDPTWNEDVSTPEDDEIEDTTAGELFQQLSDDAADELAGADAYDELSDQSPEEIIASADEAVEPMDEVDDAIAADDDFLGDLLLSGRKKEDGFLWVRDEDEEIDDDGFSFGESDEPQTENTGSSPGGSVFTDSPSSDADDSNERIGAEASTDEAEAEDAVESADDPELGQGSTLSATFGDGEDSFSETDETDDETFDGTPDGDVSEAPDESEDDDEDDESRGIASKIRSILSG